MEGNRISHHDSVLKVYDRIKNVSQEIAEKDIIEMNRRVNFYDPAPARGTTEGRLMRDYANL